MKNILFVLLFFSFSILQAQEILWLSSGLGLKVQSRLLVDFEYEGIAPTEADRALNLRPIYPAVYFLSDKGHIHLVEVSNFDLGVFERDDLFWNSLSFAMAYEYSIPLTPVQASYSWRPYLGIGLNHSIARFWLNPKASSTLGFKRKNVNFQSDVYLQPSFIKAINDRLFFDFAAQIYIGRFEGTRFVDEDPDSSFNFNSNEVRATLLKQVGVKMGFGVKL